MRPVILPGDTPRADREFIYFEIDEGGDFSTIIDQVAASFPEEFPDGGIMDEGTTIILPDSREHFMGVSYKGELARFRKMLLNYCRELNRRWGSIEQDFFVISDGIRYHVDLCDYISRWRIPDLMKPKATDA